MDANMATPDFYFKAILSDKTALKKFNDQIQNELIEKGLDKAIDHSLWKLKADLKYFINEDVRGTSAHQPRTTSDTSLTNMPKTDQDIIKYLTGLDVGNLSKTKDYTTAIDSNVVVSNNLRVRLRLPISDYETFDQNYQRALDYFNKAIFVFVDGSGNVSYYLNPGIDLTSFVKVVCSRDTGDTTKARNKFDKYKNSNNMPRQGDSEIGRFADWSLKQDAVSMIKSKFINITNVVKDIKEGNTEGAKSRLRLESAGALNKDIVEKVNDIDDKSKLSPELAIHSNIMSLINNLKIEKKLSPKLTQYELVSSYSDLEDKKSLKFFDEVHNLINTWIINNTNYWIEAFIKIAQDIIKQYE